ncbi:DUF4407 domain-containing protein [Paucibacter sp. JuS9]|uniref:DUF4407 domain-containing protein n=1 Tax=Paucibacter sp. JuS9 TaxID=3228748 RepID=UPI0037565951
MADSQNSTLGGSTAPGSMRSPGSSADSVGSTPPVGSGTSGVAATTEHADAMRTVADVKRELGLSPLESALLWICKADLYALRLSTYETRLQFQGFGILVALTAFLACGSMWFALHTTIFSGDAIGAFFAASVYAVAIFFIEREIVDPAKDSGFAIVLRVIMASLIAIVISFPLEAEILKTRIDEQIRVTVNKNFEPLREEQRQINKRADERLASASKALNDRMTSLKKQEEILLDELDKERRRVNYGDKSRALEQKVVEARAQISDTADKLLVLQNSRLSKEEADRIKEIDDDINATATRTTDPLSRLIALNEIGKKHPEANAMSWLLRLFFITLELMPAMMKFLSPKTEYSFYVKGRRALNQAKINSSINYVIEYVQRNPQSTWREVRQVLDLIEHGIEDRSTRPSRTLSDITTSMASSSNIPDLALHGTESPPSSGEAARSSSGS